MFVKRRRSTRVAATPLPNRQRAQGFTLIELMVALIVFAIGMLSLASLQSTALRTDQSSAMRWEASMLAYDMADRIRANRVAALAGDYDSDSSFSASPENCMGASNTCMPAGMADFDKSAWYKAVNALPGGSGSVVDNGDESITVTVRWDDARTGATGTNCPPVSEADLRCFIVNVAL